MKARASSEESWWAWLPGTLTCSGGDCQCASTGSCLSLLDLLSSSFLVLHLWKFCYFIIWPVFIPIKLPCSEQLRFPNWPDNCERVLFQRHKTPSQLGVDLQEILKNKTKKSSKIQSRRPWPLQWGGWGYFRRLRQVLGHLSGRGSCFLAVGPVGSLLAPTRVHRRDSLTKWRMPGSPSLCSAFLLSLKDIL